MRGGGGQSQRNGMGRKGSERVGKGSGNIHWVGSCAGGECFLLFFVVGMVVLGGGDGKERKMRYQLVEGGKKEARVYS